MTLAYRIDLTPDDDGSLLVTCPALPEVTTFAADAKEATLRARDAIEEALAGRIAASIDVPDGEADTAASGRVALPLLTALKVGLYAAARGQQVSRAELARRLAWNRESVDRLFRLDHLSRIGQIEDAYAALGLSLRVRVEAAA